MPLRCQTPLRSFPRTPNYPLATLSVKELEDGGGKQGPEMAQSKESTGGDSVPRGITADIPILSSCILMALIAPPGNEVA